jgi:polyisoprenoid-binding protein YceI
MSGRLLALLLLPLCYCSIAAENPPFSAGLVEIEFDPAKCTVQFALGALLHNVLGTFKVNRGMVRFDPASGQAGGQIAVDVRSGATGESARDRQMHENVLESSRFPNAVFSINKLEGRPASSGESQFKVHGSLSIHGGEHDMIIPVRVMVQGDSLTATAKFRIPYVAWGMKDPSNLVLRVDKIVDVEVRLSGKLSVSVVKLPSLRACPTDPPAKLIARPCERVLSTGLFFMATSSHCGGREANHRNPGAS